MNISCIVYAHTQVQRAIKAGLLPNLKLQYFDCVDCNRRRATQYDHRDYGKPLVVDAVCRWCNQKRGRGICSARSHRHQKSTKKSPVSV